MSWTLGPLFVIRRPIYRINFILALESCASLGKRLSGGLPPPWLGSSLEGGLQTGVGVGGGRPETAPA